MTPTGALILTPTHPMSGAMTPAGNLSSARSTTQSGTITPAGALIRSQAHLNAGSLAPAGSLRFGLSRAFSGSLSLSGFLQQGVGETSCDFTLADLRSRLWKMLDDAEGGTYYSVQVVDHALNRAERLFCLLTHCFEKTVSFALTNGQAFYGIKDQITDFVACLRISHAGTRLRSDTIHELDGRDSTWRTRAGNPTRYIQEGFDMFAITPQPASGVHTLQFTYSAEPPPMTLPTSVPTIPGDQQAALLDIAFYLARLPEGSIELQNATEYLKRGIDQAQKYASFVRSKSRGQIYDTQPFDLRSFERGRLDVKLAHQKTMQRKQKEGAN